MTDRDPPHYLRALLTTTVPQRMLWMDCASHSHKERGTWVYTWTAGALGTTHYTSRRRERRDTMVGYTDPAAMWHAADGFCVANRRSVLWAHDLASGLRISQALVHLPRLGWTVKHLVLEKSAAWVSFTDGNRSLLMCDLASWAPVDFDRIVSAVGAADEQDRTFPAGPEFRLLACQWRATVVRDAVLTLMDWVRGADLGPFRPTGSGQAYAAYRRRFMHDKLLVHDDRDRLGAERAGMWTGRCEAWRHGRLTRGPYVEMDMQAAYSTIAAECDVPTVARHHVQYTTPDHVARLMQRFAVLARVTVTIDTPMVPTYADGHTLWPVGTFTTWLWDPELSLVIGADAVRIVHECYVYERGPALRTFAKWVLDGMGDTSGATPDICRLVLKHWSRCLVGRMGLRYRAWEPFATSKDIDLRLATYVDSTDNSLTDLLIAGHEWMILAAMDEATESLPQIPSWVMSECRRRLWDAMTTVGLHNVVYVDTDSIIYLPAADIGPAPATGYLQQRGWSRKGKYRRLTIYGPRNLQTERERKVAGLPLTARQVAPLEFTGEVMRSIKESMRAGELDRVTMLPRTFKLAATDPRRQHAPRTQTVPFELALTQPENN